MSKFVFLNYQQPQLDQQYDQRAWAENAVEVIRSYLTGSNDTILRAGAPQTYSYGTSGHETLDVFSCNKTGAPIQVFIHGGAWRQLSRKESSFAAMPFLEAGAHFIALDFGLVPEVTLSEMVTQVRSAVKWLYQNAEMFGGGAEKIYVSGHSSGGHLAGCVATTDWAKFGLPPSVIKGALCVSGIYDLEPVRLSSRNDYLKLDSKAEHQLSPLRHLDHLACPVVVAYGQYESDEFIRQAREFAAAVEQHGHLQALIEGRGFNHFEVINTLADANSSLAQAALEQMGLLQRR